MIPALLKIRSMQLFRVLSELGLVRILIGLAVLLITSAGLINWVRAGEDLEFALAVVSISMFLIHQNRADTTFFKLYAQKARVIFQLEYLLMTAPLVLLLGVYGHWGSSISLIAVAAAIPFLNLKRRSFVLNTKLQSLIPDSAFEWKSGVRKMLIPLVVLWLIGMLGSYFMPAPLITIFLIGMLVSSFYEKMESLQILLAEELEPASFLYQKDSGELGHLFGSLCSNDHCIHRVSSSSVLYSTC